ncbi:hypothetical protein [Streptosporangium saharense]|uniref:Uncharacterized protein n=1 Tax=Streptosporangium saharense TaxID=1706840 RepID=A0A7W7QL31_9ACTN|nr:hypothetical protein [Streptosporangium saharense]MBB4915071.1 hypothetical protein [Streptosporangium saharense]
MTGLDQLTSEREHGAYTTYVMAKCRCDPCKAASAAYARERYRLQAYGRWQPWTDAEPVRAHLLHLRRYISYDSVAELAKVRRRAVDVILYGEPGKAPSARVRSETGARLLAVTADLDELLDDMRINATGSRRRLQALMTRGWSTPLVAEPTGVPRWQLDRVLIAATVVQAWQARVIRTVTARLFDQDPPRTTREQRRTVSIVRNRAIREGWAPLAAWDDIDDLDAVPDIGAKVTRDQALAEDADFLTRTGLDRDQVAERLGVTPAYLDKARSRVRARAG